MLNAQTLQVLLASLSKSNQFLINNCKSAFDAFNILCKMYKTTQMRDYVQLENRFSFIKFKVGFDPVRFVTEYENCIEDFNLLGCSFPPKFVVSIFLYKIVGINDPKTIYFSYFNNFASLGEMLNFEAVKESFLQLDHEAAAKQANVLHVTTPKGNELENKGTNIICNNGIGYFKNPVSHHFYDFHFLTVSRYY